MATNALGLSGKLMLQALAEGEQDAGKLALLAKGRLRAKTTQLKQSLVGSLTPAQRFLPRFPTDAHLASWAGMCPGNHASAGRQLTGSTRKGNVYVRGALTQAAWAAARAKQTDLSAQFRRLTTRLGERRALVAVGHSILIIVWHLLSEKASYQELGGDYFDRRNADVYRVKLIRKLEALGLKVAVEPATT